MKKMINILLAAVLILAYGCQKEEILTNNTNKIVIVTAEAGVHSFGVTTDAGWSVTMDEAAKEWCQFEGPTSGSGIGAFTVSFSENVFDGVRRGLRRQAVIKVITDDQFTSTTIYLRQSGVTPKLEFKNQVEKVSYKSTETTLAINTNLSIYEADKIVYTISGDEWITNKVFNPNGTSILFQYPINESMESSRKTTVKIAYVDAWGETFGDSIEFTQEAKPTPPELFEDINADENDNEF